MISVEISRGQVVQMLEIHWFHFINWEKKNVFNCKNGAIFEIDELLSLLGNSASIPLILYLSCIIFTIITILTTFIRFIEIVYLYEYFSGQTALRIPVCQHETGTP
jgi:hypothetical protein